MPWGAGGEVAVRQGGDRRQLTATLLRSLVHAPKIWEEELANAICSGTGRYSQNEASPPYQRVNSEEI